MFIELTAGNGKVCLVNMAKVKRVLWSDEGCILSIDDESIRVLESYETVKKLIMLNGSLKEFDDEFENSL